MILTIICVVSCLNLLSCSKDKDGEIVSFLGVWAELGNPKSYPMLITKDCIVMEDQGRGPAILLPYINASYEILEHIFAPNDEFCIYRYNRENDYYILYSGDNTDKDGNILFNTKNILVMSFEPYNEQLQVRIKWIKIEDGGYVYRKEILSNNKYAKLPENAKIDHTDFRAYFRVPLNYQ